MFRIIILALCQLLINHFVYAQNEYEKAYAAYVRADSIIDARGDYKLAKTLLEQARIVFEESDSTELVNRSDFLLVETLYLEREARACLEESQKLLDRLVDSPQDTIKSYINFYRGYSYYLIYQYQKANTEFLAALDENRIPLNNDRMNIRIKWMLAITYGALQQIDEELQTYEKVLIALDGMPDSEFKITTSLAMYENIGRSHSRLGNTEQSILSLQRALPVIQQHPEYVQKPLEARIYNAFGAAYARFASYEKAIEYLLQSLELDDQIDSWNTLAICYKRQYKFEKAIEIYEAILSRDDITKQYEAIVHSNIGSVYIELQNYPKATKYVEEGLRINRETNRRSGLVISLELLAQIHHETGKYELAEEYLKEARGQFEEQSSELSMLSSQNFWHMKDTTRAIRYGEQAVFDSDSSLYLFSVTSVATHEMIQAQLWLIQLYDQIANEENKYREKIIQLANLSHEFLLEFRDVYTGPTLELTSLSQFLYEEAIKNLGILSSKSDEQNISKEAFTFSEWSKVHALGGERRVKNAKTGYNLPEEIINKERHLKSQESFLKSKVKQFSEDSSKLVYFNEKLIVNEFSQDSLLSILRANYPRYYQLRYENETLSVDQIQQNLTTNQAFIEYFQGDSSSFVFLITADQYNMVPIGLHNDSLILQLRDDFRGEVFEQSLDEFTRKSHAVYQSYLAPIIDQLGDDITELIVVPDGNLSYIPLDILISEPAQTQTSKSLHYLLNDFQIHYTYAASLYFNDFSSLSTNNEYLAFAPKYEDIASDTSSTRRLGNFRNQITALKHNTDEVNYIASRFQGLGFFNETAHERNFKEFVKEYGVLHLAMHTIIDDEDPMNSKLVFTNTRDSLEDDVLHAFEIYNMEIPSQLTVLSACETGFGAMARGEGALSLARAFSYAGSPSIVMSHWPVDDQTTAELMRFFYDHLSRGLTKSEALRQAKLDFMNATHSARVHPFFWGSFVILGDDTPIRLKPLPPFHPIWILLIGLMIMFPIGYLMKKHQL